jgi:DNA processing protein
VIDACDRCLRRSHLVAFLAGDVERLLPPGRPARAQVLEAETQTLVAAAAPARQEEARRFLAGFEPGLVRAGLVDRDLEAVCVHAEGYPAPLRDLRQPPPVLYATRLARVVESDEPGVVLIGSRHPSEYGRTVAYRLGRGLGAARVPVVSGLALGIDALAHRGCLDGGGSTVAVLASGVDVAYPRTNRRLYERIRRDGAIVSEMPPGARPYRWLFPARNRIMAALGRLTVVVEAAERSGTLITADCAADIGREVAAVPGWVTADVAVGTNGLLRQGAALVASAQDVLDLLYGVGAREAPSTAPRAAALDTDEARVLELVTRGAAIDELISEANVSAGTLRAILARLELRGLVRRGASGGYVPAA